MPRGGRRNGRYGFDNKIWKFSLCNNEIFTLWENRWEHGYGGWTLRHYIFGTDILSFLDPFRIRFISFAHDCSVVMLGLQDSGKTSIVQRLKNGQQMTGKGALIRTGPTIGFNVDNMECDFGCGSFPIWDVGGSHPQLWKHYYKNRRGVTIIFVVDASKDDLTEEREQLQKVLERLEDFVPLLVLANKQDKDTAIDAKDVANKLRLYVEARRSWHVQECSAMNNDGVQEGWDWIMSAMTGKPNTLELQKQILDDFNNEIRSRKELDRIYKKLRDGGDFSIESIIDCCGSDGSGSDRIYKKI